MTLQELFEIRCTDNSDISEHLPILKKYGDKCASVIEFGVSRGYSTTAFLYSSCKKIISYDINDIQEFKKILCTLEQYDNKFEFRQASSLATTIENTDILFIDSLHTHDQLLNELLMHSMKAKKYIIIHDVITFGIKGEFNNPRGLLEAIFRFLITSKDGKNWRLKELLTNNNGLLVIERICE